MEQQPEQREKNTVETTSESKILSKIRIWGGIIVGTVAHARLS